MPSDPTDSSTSFSDGSSSSIKNRSDMVEAARQFMSTPKVRNTSFEEQKKFLLEKGLTELEIEEAFKMLPPAADPSNGMAATSPYSQQQPMYYQHPPQSFGGKLYSFTQSMVVIGGASYMAYKVMRTWVLPKFFNIPDSSNDKLEHLQTQVNELQNSTKFIMDSVEQTLQTVSAQQEQLNRALLLMSQNGGGNKSTELNRLQTDVAIVKSLLLNQNQFPAIPIPTNATPNQSSTTTQNNGVLKQPKTVRWQTNSIPSWQLANGNANNNNNSSESQVNGNNGNHQHLNGKENGEDEKNEEEIYVEAQNDTI